MNGWDELVGRLTRRLEVDEELRLDVARELRCHLEDSAAEFRAAGESAKQATASAVKALGNEEELAEQLWQANRSRIRIRGLLRWTARVTLLPAAVIVVLVLFTYLVGIGGYLRGLRGRGGWAGGPPWPMGPLGKLVCDPRAGVRLTEDQRWLLDGDPNAKTLLEQAKSITERWPDNPVYYAHYMTFLLGRNGIETRKGEAPRVDEQRLEQVLAALRKGERIDPDNAFYNTVIASLLVAASCIVQDDPSTTYDRLRSDGKIVSVPVETIEVTDAPRFQAGLEELRRGLSKPHMTGRSLEMLRVRLDVLPAPTRLIQYLDRVSIWYCTPLPGLQGFRQLSRSLLAYSRLLASQGQSNEAPQIPPEVERIAIKMGAQAGFPVELLVAQAIRQQALGYEEVINKELGRSQAAETARLALREADELWNRILEGRRLSKVERSQFGLLERELASGLPGYKSDLKPLRTAEHFVFAEVGLMILLAVLVLVAVILGVGTLLDLAILPKAERPVLVFVGWRRLGRICVLGVALPVAVYACYLVGAAVCGARLGLAGAWDRVAVEFVGMVLVVLWVVAMLGKAAVAQRAAELGMAVVASPPWRTHPWRMAALGGLVVVMVAYVVGWWAGPFRAMWPPAGDVGMVRRASYGLGQVLAVLLIMVGAALGAAAIGWVVSRVVRRAVSQRKPAPAKAERPMRPLRLGPTVSVIVIVVALVLGVLLAVAEGPRKADAWNVLGIALVLALTLVAPGWLFWWALWGRYAPTGAGPEMRRVDRTVNRSLVPILASMVIVVGLALGGVLAVGEGWAIRQTGTGLPMPDEIANSDFRLLKERFIEMDKSFHQAANQPVGASGR